MITVSQFREVDAGLVNIEPFQLRCYDLSMIKIKLILALVIAALAGVSYLMYKDFTGSVVGQDCLRGNSQLCQKDVTDSPSTGTSTVNIGGLDITTTGGGASIQVEQLPVSGYDAKVPLPDLSKSFVFPAGYSHSAKEMDTKKMQELVAALKKDPGALSAWLDLASYRKNHEDYAGAEEIYVYLNKSRPTNYFSPLNLGTLYHYYMKKYPDAEAQLLRAEKNGPSIAMVYKELFYLYSLSYKEKAGLAEAALLRGIKNIPGNIELTSTLAEYYRDKGLEAKADEYYNKVIATADKLGDKVLAAKFTKIRDEK